VFGVWDLVFFPAFDWDLVFDDIGMNRGADEDREWLETPTLFDEHSPIAYVSFDDQARVTQMNAGAAKLLGVQRQAFLGLPLPAALDPNEVPKFLEHLHRCRQGSETQISTELKLGRRFRARIAVELATTPTLIHGQRRFPTAILDLRRSEQRLQMVLKAKELAEHLFEFVSYPLAALNENLILEATNSAFREKFHAHATELNNHSLFELEMVHWRSEKFGQALRRVVMQREAMKELIVECSLAPSGQRLTLLANAMRLVPRPGARPLILLTFEDITHRRRHEEEREAMLAQLRHMNTTLEQRVRERTAELHRLNAQLKALSLRVIEAQETERRYLARDLHDEVGQALTGLNMLLHRAPDGAADEEPANLREARRVVAELLQRIRQMSFDLRPAVLDDLGLCMAVRSHIDTFARRTGIRVRFECENISEENLAPEVKITAFRALQESLTNVARHSRAQTAIVGLRLDGAGLHLEVTDAGKGFRVKKARTNGGSGLAGMRERVELAGGQLELESTLGRGTRVRVQLPLRHRKGEPGDNNRPR